MGNSQFVSIAVQRLARPKSASCDTASAFARRARSRKHDTSKRWESPHLGVLWPQRNVRNSAQKCVTVLHCPHLCSPVCRFGLRSQQLGTSFSFGFETDHSAIYRASSVPQKDVHLCLCATVSVSTRVFTAADALAELFAHKNTHVKS